MKLQDKTIQIRLPREVIEMAKNDDAHYQTKLTEIIMNYYSVSLLGIKQLREANNEK